MDINNRQRWPVRDVIGYARMRTLGVVVVEILGRSHPQDVIVPRSGSSRDSRAATLGTNDSVPGMHGFGPQEGHHPCTSPIALW